MERQGNVITKRSVIQWYKRKVWEKDDVRNRFWDDCSRKLCFACASHETDGVGKQQNEDLYAVNGRTVYCDER